MRQVRVFSSIVVVGIACALTAPLGAQGALSPGQAGAIPPAPTGAAAGVTPPTDYVVGPDDSLSILYWNHKEMASEVVVRPDGKISLPLLNDVQASGLTPDQLRAKIVELAAKFIEDPNVMVIVKDIKSRQVFITGQVAKSGPYPINGPMTVLQLISIAGGLQEYADGKHISIIRVEKGQPVSFPFNYDEVVKKRRNLAQNIQLRPGDQVVVP